jgi:hypothetical protein
LLFETHLPKFLEEIGRVAQNKLVNCLKEVDFSELHLVYVGIADLLGNLSDLLMFLLGDEQLYWSILVEDSSDFVKISIVVEFRHKEVVCLRIENESCELGISMIDGKEQP